LWEDREAEALAAPLSLRFIGRFTIMGKAASSIAGAIAALLVFGASASAETGERIYDAATGGWTTINERPAAAMASPVPREEISYDGDYGAGTIIVNTAERRLYFVHGDGTATRYGIGVGRPGFTWNGSHRVTRMAEWPGWTPPPAMRRRQPDLPGHMPGGPDNPLGSRALYIGSTIYRIHGTSEPWTIGQAVSSGCIRMTNEDVAHLYEQVDVGARVVVQH
jgi:lipoprotein-anchoring transpeptidase ErfK/SrfK